MKWNILESGSISISPIFKSQEIQKNRAQLTQSSFLGLCSLLDFLKKWDILESGSISISPIFKSQEIQKNRAQLTQYSFLGLCPLLDFFKDAGHFGSWLCFYQSHLQESINPKEQSTTDTIFFFGTLSAVRFF